MHHQLIRAADPTVLPADPSDLLRQGSNDDIQQQALAIERLRLTADQNSAFLHDVMARNHAATHLDLWRSVGDRDGHLSAGCHR